MNSTVVIIGVATASVIGLTASAITGLTGPAFAASGASANASDRIDAPRPGLPFFGSGPSEPPRLPLPDAPHPTPDAG
jgi:hypothetical protein